MNLYTHQCRDAASRIAKLGFDKTFVTNQPLTRLVREFSSFYEAIFRSILSEARLGHSLVIATSLEYPKSNDTWQKNDSKRTREERTEQSISHRPNNTLLAR